MREPLTFEIAHTAALAAVRSARAEGVRACVAVVNRSGILAVLLCDDGVGLMGLETAQRKAYTAAATGMSSRRFAEFARLPEMAAAPPTHIDPRLLAVPGGVPIVVDEDEVIGGIGVGGADGDIDERLAFTAIESIATLIRLPA